MNSSIIAGSMVQKVSNKLSCENLSAFKFTLLSNLKKTIPNIQEIKTLIATKSIVK